MHISLSEILLIGIVALLVLKPAQLPVAARALGRWLKWLKQTNEKIKQEMEKPLDLFSYENKLPETKKQTEETHP
jgi:sec-independent protein translocase protein TatB